MDFSSAIVALESGEKVKLPEWQGYWFKQDDLIKVMDRHGDIHHTPYLDDYKNRTDWEITNGMRDFGGALTAIKAGKLLAREGWNGKKMFVFERPQDDIPFHVLPDIKSLPMRVKKWFDDAKLHEGGWTGIRFRSYLCLKSADNEIVNGWVPSQSDLSAKDWVIIA